MKDYKRKRQRYANALVEVDESSFTNAFLREYGEQALERADDVRKSDLKSDVSPDGRGETVVYQFMEKQGLVTEVSGNNYRVNFTETEAELFRDQLEEHFSDEYGRHELIAHLQTQAEKLTQISGDEKSPTTEYFRVLDEESPTEQPYKNNFGSFSWALHVAGLESNEELSRDMLEDRLRTAVHEKNEGSEYILETLSAREINGNDSLSSEKAYRDAFGSLEAAYREAGLAPNRGIEKDVQKWQEIIQKFPQVEEADETNLSAVYPRITELSN